MRYKSSVLLNGLRDYGVQGQIGLEETPEEWCARLVVVFREVRRVLRPEGTLWVEIGDSYNSGTNARRNPTETASHGRWENEALAQRVNVETCKPKDLLGQPWMLAFALRADGWYLRSEIIWEKPNCLSGGTWLYARTQKGEMPQMLKDLVRLRPETVELWNGEKWTRVIKWTPSSRDVQLEIELRNGERIGATAEHLWPTSRGLLRTDALQVGDVIDACRLPGPEQPTSFMNDAQIGYLVGLYLAEGSMSGQMVQIASHAQEVGERQRRLDPLVKELHGSSYVWRDARSNAATLNLNGPLCGAAIRAYIGGANAHTKHLLPRAWSRSNEFLRAVMVGYLDGDGHWEAKTGRWRLGFCANDSLARDLRTLAARLGWSLRLRRSRTGWKGSVRVDTTRRKSPDTQIIAIRRSRARQFWDVTVEDAPHTFSLASGTLTHNCMPESVGDRPTRSHSTVFLLSKSRTYYYDADAIRDPFRDGNRGAGQGFRWNSPHYTEQDGPLDNTLGGLPPEAPRGPDGRRVTAVKGQENSHQHRDGERWPNPEGANARSVWTIPTEPTPFAHFATWPKKLVARMIQAGSREGDTVLDPFAGSGTTLFVARALGRHSVGIELNAEYCQLAVERTQQLSLLT